MKSVVFIACLMVAGTLVAPAQDTAGNRALTMAEYAKTPTFFIKDLDKDTYVKFDNTYILDKGEFPKPYFITGDDGKKKRIDLYKLILKDGRVELGIMVFYTTENGKRYFACMPSYKADPKIWEKYFEDIHSIEKEEPFFVLKLSYVLSKELGFQLYKAQAGMQGKEINREAGTYGNDICFPGDMQVTMADGSAKSLSLVKAGDAVRTVDPVTRQVKTVNVKELTVHEAKNYAITELLLLAVATENTSAGKEVCLLSKLLRATPNHPMVTLLGEKKAGELKEGDKVLCLDEKTGRYTEFTVWEKKESAGGVQKVYNIVAGGGDTFIMNDVMVLQKPLKN
jgi:hypothetical protein